MRDHAQGHAPRMAGDLGEVIKFEGQPHAEHHQAQQRDDGAFQADEPAGFDEGQHGKDQHPVGEGIADKATQGGECAHGEVLIISWAEKPL